jgi:hypothetical protein
MTYDWWLVSTGLFRWLIYHSGPVTTHQSSQMARRVARIIELGLPWVLHPIDLVVTRQDSSAVVQVWFERFLDHFANDGAGDQDQPWLREFTFNAFNKFRDALGLSIQAASVAFCAMQSSHPDALRRTRDVYGRALSSQNKLLSGLGRSAKSATPTRQMICTTVMLSYYEAIMIRHQVGMWVIWMELQKRCHWLDQRRVQPRVNESSFLRSSDPDGESNTWSLKVPIWSVTVIEIPLGWRKLPICLESVPMCHIKIRYGQFMKCL